MENLPKVEEVLKACEEAIKQSRRDRLDRQMLEKDSFERSNRLITSEPLNF